MQALLASRSAGQRSLLFCGRRAITILGIETSCDDTAAAVVRWDAAGGTVLAEASASQHELHAPHGGIVPTLAARAHRANLPEVLTAVRASAGAAVIGSLDAVAVTVGPGLSPCLHVGPPTPRSSLSRSRTCSANPNGPWRHFAALEARRGHATPLLAETVPKQASLRSESSALSY